MKKAEETLKTPYTVLFASQRRLLILGVRAMCDEFDEIDFIGAAVDSAALMVYLKRTPVDIVLLPWDRCSDHPMETLRRIASAERPPKIVIMAESPNPETVREALLNGASGFISEECDDDQFKDVLVAVGHGHIVIETGARAEASDPTATAPKPETLTERERDVATLIASGLSTKQIAAALFLSPKTVETHRTNLKRKLGLLSVADVVRYAIHSGMLASGPPQEQAAQRSAS